MRQLGGSKIDDDLIKSLWLRRLPEGTQAVLACVSGSLEALARGAYAPVQQPLDEVGELKREIAALAASMAEMRAAVRELAPGLLLEEGDRVAGRQDSLRTEAFAGTVAIKLPDIRSRVNSRLPQKTRFAGDPGATSPNDF